MQHSGFVAAELLLGQLEGLPRARVTRHIPDLFAANGLVPVEL
jgi:type III secretory pathway lipoprotein EscJ